MFGSSKCYSTNKLFIFFALLTFSLFSFLVILYFGLGVVKAALVETDLEVKVDEVIALSLVNCDLTNSSIIYYLPRIWLAINANSS